MPNRTGRNDREQLRELIHDMRGALNNLGTALTLCEIQAGAREELASSIEIALRGYAESIRLFEQIVRAARVDEDAP